MESIYQGFIYFKINVNRFLQIVANWFSLFLGSLYFSTHNALFLLYRVIFFNRSFFDRRLIVIWSYWIKIYSIEIEINSIEWLSIRLYPVLRRKIFNVSIDISSRIFFRPFFFQYKIGFQSFWGIFDPAESVLARFYLVLLIFRVHITRDCQVFLKISLTGFQDVDIAASSLKSNFSQRSPSETQQKEATEKKHTIEKKVEQKTKRTVGWHRFVCRDIRIFHGFASKWASTRTESANPSSRWRSICSLRFVPIWTSADPSAFNCLFSTRSYWLSNGNFGCCQWMEIRWERVGILWHSAQCP